MAGRLEDLGRRALPLARKGRWWWKSLTAPREERIRAEEAVGRDLAAVLEAEHGLDPDPDVQRFVTEIGAHLVGKLRGSRRFAIRVLRPKEPNAFALPGGVIYVDRSLLHRCEFRVPPLAFVLGHEIGHVVQEHAWNRLLAEKALGLASRVAPTPALLGGWLRGQGDRLLRSAYSRRQEEEADRFGLRLARAAGFPAEGAFELLSILETLEAERPGEDCAWLRTHPPARERIARLRAVAEKKDRDAT